MSIEGIAEATMEAQVIVDITREAEQAKLVEVDPTKLYAMACDAEREVLDLSQYLDTPKRARGTVTLQTVDDFARYITRHDSQDGTTVWVDMDTHRIVGVLDDHGQEAPGWGEHRAVLQLKPTDAWTHWTRGDGMMDQEAFAEHIEEGLKEIGSPSSAELLEIVTTMRGKTKAEWKSGIRLQDGAVNFAYTEEATATAGGAGQLEIPSRIILGIAPFLGEEQTRLDARLRYRVSGGKLSIGYKLDRPGDVVRDAIDHIADRLSQTFTDRTFIGRPR